MLKDSGKRRYTRYFAGYRKGNIVLIEKVEKGHKWKYVCDCGHEGVTQISENPGYCPVCSRKKAAEKLKRHGEAPSKAKNASRLYRIWLGMNQRCFNSNNSEFYAYGGRGISVCSEWRNDYLKFKEWAIDNSYNDALSLDRINVNGNYEPSNCRWATQEIQCNNKRNTRRYLLNGQMYTINDLSKMSGLSKEVIKHRLNQYGWDVEDAISIVPKVGNNQKTRRKSND